MHPSYRLRSLRPLDIENLACGRITNLALMEALNRCQSSADFRMDELRGARTIATYSHILLADELNEMLSAAKSAGVL